MFGVYSMGTGDKRRQQLLMRGRVAAQAFTLAAFGYGLYTMRGVSHKQISREKERERKEKAENAEE